MGPGFTDVNVLGEPMALVDGTDGGASYIRPPETQARIRSIGVVNHYAFKSERDFQRRIERGLLGEFVGQTVWRGVVEEGGVARTLADMNAVEDTYLADYWRRLLGAGQAARMVPPVRLPNVALGKQADQSSRSEWSRGATTQEDAAGPVNGTITGDAQCHTDMETQPWWMVDLGAPYLIYEVRVFNRVSQPVYRTRLGAFRIDIMDPAGNWVPIHEDDGNTPIGGADGYPLIVTCRTPTVATRLRVTALGRTYLHLDQVQVHGVPMHDTGAAAVATSLPAAPIPMAPGAPSPADTREPAPVPSVPVTDVPDDRHGHPVPARQREVARIPVLELLQLAQHEAVIREDFLYVASVAPAGRYRRPAPLCQDTEDALPLTQLLYAEYMERLEQAVPASFHVALRDATVFGQGSVVTASNALLLDSCWELFSQDGVPPGLTRLANGHFRLEPLRTRRIDRPSLMVKRPFWRNYGHWLMDGAAVLALLPKLNLPEGCQIIIGRHEDPKMRAIMRETLDILAPGLPVFEQPDDEIWTVPQLHYVTPQQISPLVKQPAALAALAGRLRAGQPMPPATRRLYVTRDAGLGRRLVNEAQVIALCREFGFEVVSPERLNLGEQAALFAAAECVIGVKGAALANIVFCPATARLFVLSPSDWPEPFFWDLAGLRGLGYGEMFGPFVRDDGRQSMHPFSIDIERLARNLTAFCGPAAPGLSGGNGPSPMQAARAASASAM